MSDTIYAVGDIHGCRGHLERLLDVVQPDLSRDRLVFMGDYIDRGPDSRGVVDYILGLQKINPPEHIICLKGNHEAMLLDYLADREMELFLFNGGLSTIREYGGRRGDPGSALELPPDHLAFFRGLRNYYEPPDYIFVHGGLRPGVPLAEQAEEDLFWIRGEFIASFEDFGRRVIFGHTPFRRPLVMPNKIGIDTGAVYGNLLTCLKLPEEIFYFAGHDSVEKTGVGNDRR
ncbi:MAG: serine/threonine protein phosphatase [Deltaproteobacteria bacterium]|nr:serine/threonine protein phosphatase [Deltaproteobacteria bacterium]